MLEHNAPRPRVFHAALGTQSISCLNFGSQLQGMGRSFACESDGDGIRDEQEAVKA